MEDVNVSEKLMETVDKAVDAIENSSLGVEEVSPGDTEKSPFEKEISPVHRETSFLGKEISPHETFVGSPLEKKQRLETNTKQNKPEKENVPDVLVSTINGNEPKQETNVVERNHKDDGELKRSLVEGEKAKDGLEEKDLLDQLIRDYPEIEDQGAEEKEVEEGSVGQVENMDGEEVEVGSACSEGFVFESLKHCFSLN